MASNFSSLTVTWYDESDGYSTTEDISDEIIALPLFTDTGSGEVNEAEIVITGARGIHLTSGNIFDKYDRFRIQCTDLGSNTYDRYFEVTDIIPAQTKSEGSTITLQCLGIEYHTQLIHYARRDWFENAFEVAQKIGDAYESNNGSRQPTIQRHDTAYSTSNQYGNELPTWTNNHYEFGANEDTCYNRWMDLIDLLGGAVTNGGVGDFFEVGFDTPSVNVIDTAIFVSGARTFDGNDPTNDGSAVVIQNTNSINVSEQEAGISNPTGTKVAAWGSPIHGSLPLGTSKYAAHVLEFVFRPEWRTSVLYKVGAKVIDVDTGKHYECATEHTSGTFSTDLGAGRWTLIDYSSEFGDSIQYSEWTDGRAKHWANAGADPDGVTSIPAWATSTAYTIGDLVSNGGSDYVVIEKHTSGTFATDLSNGKLELVDNALKGNGAAFFDANTVIRDEGTMFRTWVNEVIGDTDYDTVNDATLSSEYLHTNNTNPVGHRVLNISDTQLSGTDERGKNFVDAVCQWTNARSATDNGQWEVIYEQPDSTLDKMQVFDIKDRKIWEWIESSSEWQDKTTDSPYRNDDCAHEWKSVYNIAGSDPRPTKQSTTPFNEDSNDFSTNIRSAVEVCYEFTNIANDFISGTGDGKKGAWMVFGFPYPVSTYNSISGGVGDIWGGGTNESNPTFPSLLDTQNMTWTSDGKIGFNHTTSEELGPLSSIALNMRIAINDILGNALNGAATVRCFMLDIRDNVVVQDFEVKFTDGLSWQPVNLPFTGFTNYRGRVPKNWLLRIGSVAGFTIPIKELDVQDVFEYQHIKYIGFQIQEFYDEEGRYDPHADISDLVNTGFQLGAGGTIRMAIDAFHFKKVLLATTGQPSVQNIEPQFLQRPNIISYLQLKNEANSQLEIEQFRLKQFNFQTSGSNIFDIRFGDTFFLLNTDLINDADKDETSLGAGDGDANTIRLVAKRIEYHITKPTNGPGGLTRSIKGIKRFTS